MKLIAKLFIFLLLLGILSAAPAGAQTTVNDVSKGLMCQCPDCVMTLDSCDCGFADNMRLIIAEKIDQGQTKGQILDYFVAIYGEQVLTTPSKSGFNLIVWIAPFGVLLVGGGAVFFALRTWVGQGRSLQIEEVAAGEEVDDEYQSKLEKELDEFTQEGFR